jgi:hypothetical protein
MVVLCSHIVELGSFRKCEGSSEVLAETHTRSSISNRTSACRCGLRITLTSVTVKSESDEVLPVKGIE